MNHEGDDACAKRKLGEKLCLGSIYYKQSQYNKAAEIFKAVLEIARETGDSSREGAMLGNLANAYKKLGEYDKAAEMFEAGLVIAQEIGDKNQQVRWLGSLGAVYMDHGRYYKAAEKYEVALEIAREIGDRNQEGMWLGNVGTAYGNLGEYDKAAEKLEAGLEIAQEIGDRNQEGMWLGDLGAVYSNLGEYDKAAEMFEAGLVISQEIGDKNQEGRGLGNLGTVYLNLGQYNEAAEKFKAGLEIAQKIGDRNGEGMWLGNLGNVYTNLGEYDKAAEKLEAGLEIAQEIGDRRGEGMWLGGLGAVYSNLGEYDKAAEMFEAGLVIAQEIGDRRGENMWLGGLGNVYANLGEYDKAAEMFEAGLAIAREIGDRSREGTMLGNVGNIYVYLGQYDKAAEKYEAGLEIAREIGDRNQEGRGLGNVSTVYGNLGRYDKAAEKLEAGLEIARKIGDRRGEGMWLGGLGKVYICLGEYDKAAETLETGLEIAREIGDRNQQGTILGSLGNVYMDLEQFDKAAGKIEAGLEIAREVKDRNGEGRGLGYLGACHYYQSDNLQHRKKALDYLQQSIRVFDDLWMDIKEDDQKVTFDDVNGSSSKFAKYLHSLFWNTGHFKNALLAREQSSSKSLELLLLKNRKDTAKVENLSKQSKSVTTFEQMRKIAIQSKSAIIVYGLHEDGDILIWVIESGNAEGIRLVHQKVHVKKEYKSLQYLVESTRRSLGASDRKHFTERRNKDGELQALEMLLAGDDKNHVDVFNDSDLHTVEDELRKAGCGPIDGPNITMKKALRQLYDLLILPIEGALVDEQRLTIVPFGDLFALPFAALLDQKGAHLIQKHILSFAPSVGTLVELQHNRTIPNDKKGSTVIVGTGKNLSGARKEAEQVHIIVTGNGQERKVKKFIGKQATKEVVVKAMQSADIIHLATHGSKDGIFLSGLMGTKDVKLTMGEVQSLDLKGTKMVVLSACDTFKGDLRTDGVVGITRSFLAAGSSTVIASLWPVGDNSTKEMMVRLYKYLFQEKECADVNDHDDGKGGGDDTVDVSYALQQVMVGMLKEKGGIFDIKQWAPFLVYGLNTSVGN